MNNQTQQMINKLKLIRVAVTTRKFLIFSHVVDGNVSLTLQYFRKYLNNYWKNYREIM